MPQDFGFQSDEVTHLDPNEESSFQNWIKQNGITDLDHPDSHYDYRGFYKATKGAPHPPGSQLHFPDTFKQHGHPTFSVESQYSKGANDGGRWEGDKFIPQPDNNEDEFGFKPDFKGESEHPLAGIEDWMDSKRAAFIKNHPIISNLLGKAGEVGKGVLDVGKNVYSSVNEAGKKGSEDLLSGNFPAAFHDVTAPLTGVINQVNEKLLSGNFGFEPDQARHEGINQLVGIAGAPGNEMQEAYHEGNYSRLAGQIIGTAGLGYLAHKIGSRGVTGETKLTEPRGPISDEFTKGAEHFKTDEVPPLRPDASLVPPGEEHLFNSQFEPRNRPTPESLALSKVPELPPEMGTPQNPAKHAEIYNNPTEERIATAQNLPEGFTLGKQENGFKKVPFSTIDDNEASDLYRASKGYLTGGNKAERMEVPVKDLISTQKTYQPDIVEGYKSGERVNSQSEVPQVLEHEGKYYLSDGTHRAIAALENGEENINADVYKVDPERLAEIKALKNEEPTGSIKPKVEGDIPPDAKGRADLLKQIEDAKAENEQLKGRVEPESKQTINKPVQDGFAQPKFAEDNNLVNEGSKEVPPPGQFKAFNDVSPINAEGSSVHKLLASRPETKPISDTLVNAQDKGTEWLASNMRDFEEVFHGLSDEDAIKTTQLINHGTQDIAYNLKNGITPDLIARAKQFKSLTDEVHNLARQSGVTNKEGKPIGYFDQYFPYMQKMPEGMQNQIKEIWNHYVGRNSPMAELFLGKGGPPTDKGLGVTGDIYNKGQGDPWSIFAQTRKGMNPADINWNPRQVVPAFLESMKKVIFDGPAIDKATEQLKNVPQSNLKDAATWAIKNFSGYDADKNLHQAYDSAASQAARITARSYVSGNLPLHALHLGEIPVNIYPELGEKYSLLGAAKVIRHPLDNYTEMARMGMLQGEIKPWAFKTASERADSVGYFFSSVESFVKGIAYQGSKAKFIAEGMEPEQAKYAAMAKAKDLTLTVDKARQMKWLSPESKIMGGEVASKLGQQFKGIPSKIVEQYIDIAREVAKNPDKMDPYLKVMRALAGSASAGVATAYGAHMMHVNPTSLVKMTAFGPFANSMYQIFGNDVYNAGKRMAQGDDNGAKQYLMQAAIDTAALITPGGNSIRKGVGEIFGEETIKPGKYAPKPMKLRFSNPVKVNLNQ